MGVLQLLLLAVSTLLLLGWAAVRCHTTLHLLQLDSYSNRRLIKWLCSRFHRRLFHWEVGLFALLLLALDSFLSSRVLLTVWILGGGLLLWQNRPEPAKKPLVYTSRAKRIVAVGFIISSVLPAAVAYTALAQYRYSGGIDDGLVAVFLITVLLVTQGSPLAVLVANMLLVPVQRAINWGYLIKAKGKLRRVKPRVIGVAGSYGKTSTKYFTATILAEKYRVLKTPQSFNTLLGVCRCINEMLEPEHQVLVVEIGAYQRGDVMEKCRFVHPTIGVLTTIGPEHFERFKSMENIMATNYELIESLPEDGVAVFNVDNEFSRELADRTKAVRVLRYGLCRKNGELTLTAEKISTGPEGLRFTIVREKEKGVECQCRILGRHNVANILGAACVGLEMGLTLEEISRGVAKIEPAPHRLQIMPGANGVTIIDDSYNSNPIGAKEALTALGEFPSGRKVLVTPGMVELGELEYEENKALGKLAAGVCDFVILVGPKQTKPIQDGLREAKFPEEKLRIVANLQEATTELGKILSAGDTVLFENDLPDLYAE